MVLGVTGGRPGKDPHNSESSDQPLPGARVPQRLQECPQALTAWGSPCPAPEPHTAWVGLLC